MGVLVLRQVMERRGELALLRAVGYSRRQAADVVRAEHHFLVVVGLATGTLASALAVGPSALQPQNHIPFGLLAIFLLGTAVLSVAWIRLATALALRSPLVPALRHELCNETNRLLRYRSPACNEVNGLFRYNRFPGLFLSLLGFGRGFDGEAAEIHVPGTSSP